MAGLCLSAELTQNEMRYYVISPGTHLWPLHMPYRTWFINAEACLPKYPFIQLSGGHTSACCIAFTAFIAFRENQPASMLKYSLYCQLIQLLLYWLEKNNEESEDKRSSTVYRTNHWPNNPTPDLLSSVLVATACLQHIYPVLQARSALIMTIQLIAAVLAVKDHSVRNGMSHKRNSQQQPILLDRRTGAVHVRTQERSLEAQALRRSGNCSFPANLISARLMRWCAIHTSIQKREW